MTATERSAAPVHDFRSDTVTLPTPAMMEAIAAARLGDAARGDDPTVRALEALARALTGKDDALLLPSGVMANLAALLGHGCGGGEVIVEASAHVYNAEGGGISALAGALVRPLRGERGLLAPEAVAAAIVGSGDPLRAPTRLVCLENTHNAAGGIVVPLDNLAALRSVAGNAGVPLHLDGARLFNAAAHLGVPIAALCRHADSVWFSLCKGLGCPIGAVLAGDAAFMARARRAARMLGGGMRQAGVIAAPALVALEGDPMSSHRRDHALAQRLARQLAEVEGVQVEPAQVQTNIVNCFVAEPGGDAAGAAERLRAHGVLVNGSGRKLRFVTHAQVDEASVDAAVRAMAAIFAAPAEPLH